MVCASLFFDDISSYRPQEEGRELPGLHPKLITPTPGPEAIGRDQTLLLKDDLAALGMWTV